MTHRNLGYVRSWRKSKRHFPWAYILVPALLAALALWAHLAGFGLEPRGVP